jgi:hypothetical protein
LLAVENPQYKESATSSVTPRLRHLVSSVIANGIDYAKFHSRSDRAVIRVYDEAGNEIETHEHAGDFKEW